MVSSWRVISGCRGRYSGVWHSHRGMRTGPHVNRKGARCFLGAIQLLSNADGGWGVRFSGEKALRRCKVQCYLRYEGVGGVQFPDKKALRNT